MSSIQELIYRYRKKELTFNDFVFEVSLVNDGVCEWGSCYYALPLAIFTTFNILDGIGMNALEVIGLSDDLISNPQSLDKVLEDISKDLIKFEMLGDQRKEKLELYRNMLQDNKLDNAFYLMRKSAYDLFEATQLVSKSMFNTNFINIQIDSKNITRSYATGIICYLIYKYQYIEDFRYFAGFDT